MLRSVVRHFLFRPAPFAKDWQPPPLGLAVEDVEIVSSDATRIHAWWAIPNGWHASHGAVLYCHGNEGNLSHRGESLRRWIDQFNMGVLIFDYPGYGRSQGSPTEAGCYAAAEAGYQLLRHFRQVAQEKILVYGGSLGGAVALDVASRWALRAVVLVAAFASLAEMARKRFPWLPAGRLLRGCWDNLGRIGLCKSPVFIAHGTADRMVPFSHAQRLYDAANEPKHLFPMLGFDHHHSPGPDFYKGLREFLAAHDTIADELRR
jgi:fermentation-respiration switch protein FrsA (DUF1100 family)